MKSKRILSLMLGIALCFGVAACGGGVKGELKVRADVQKLWGQAEGSDNYPQSALVVKSSLIESDPGFVYALYSSLKSSANFAENNPKRATETVDAHMSAGTASTIGEISSDSVKGCNIEILSAGTEKQKINNYLEIWNVPDQLGSSPIGGKLPDEDFYYDPVETEASADVSPVTVYMPDGAPALALCGLMSGDTPAPGGREINYTVVSGSALPAAVKTGKADVAVIPTNAAAKLYNTGTDIRLVATVTQGNLYILGYSELKDLNGLKGKVLDVFQKGNVPDLVIRHLLDEAGVRYADGDRAVSGKVVLNYMENSIAIVKHLKLGKADFGLVAEPESSAAISKTELWEFGVCKKKQTRFAPRA